MDKLNFNQKHTVLWSEWTHTQLYTTTVNWLWLLGDNINKESNNLGLDENHLGWFRRGQENYSKANNLFTFTSSPEATVKLLPSQTEKPFSWITSKKQHKKFALCVYAWNCDSSWVNWASHDQLGLSPAPKYLAWLVLLRGSCSPCRSAATGADWPSWNRCKPFNIRLFKWEGTRERSSSNSVCN